MWTLAPIAVIAMLLAGACEAQLDRAAIVEAYKQWDLSKNDGKGASENADSGSLGWGEAGYLRSYSDLWLVTGDAYWLAKIEDHFGRIIANATDPDGDGFPGWQTATYSAPVYWCQALCNRGTGVIDPPFFREVSPPKNVVYLAHTYVITFLDAQSYAVQDQTIRQAVGEKQAYKDGATITAVPGCKVRISGAPAAGDRFMVRVLPAEPTEFTVHEGMIAYPAAVFIESVSRDPALKERFGASADKFLAFMNRNLLQKHEQHWLDLENGAGAYRFADLITDRFPNRVMPHNQYLALARAYLVLKDVPGADPLMGKRAEQMARLFRASLIEQDRAFVWHYWDWVEAGQPGASGLEDTSHGAIDVGFAVEAARRGVVFTPADMERLARTVVDLMWNQSETDAKLGKNCGTRGNEFAFIYPEWLDLCRWEPRVWEIALKTYSAKPGGVAAGVRMLRAQSLRAAGQPE